MTANEINVLIACEESQAEMMAFRSMGFNVYSADLQKARYDSTRHIQGDVTPLLKEMCDFVTQDGVAHHVDKWHMIIAHPPCTYLCKVGSPHLYKEPTQPITTIKGVLWLNADRYRLMRKGREFFMKCLHAHAQFVAVENPLPMAIANLPAPSCYADPSWYGVKYTKKTLYWLKNLPPLMAGAVNPDAKCYVTASRGKYRSRTFTQMAEAIASQWGSYVLNELNNGRFTDGL